MPQRLSDPAWVAFQNDVDVNALGLPPWGGIVDWQGRAVLVFVGANAEVFLTDVSDIRSRFQGMPTVYDASSETWVYHLPLEVMREIGMIARTTLEATGKAFIAASETVGEAAGSLTAPLLRNLALPLIVIVLVYLFDRSR